MIHDEGVLKKTTIIIRIPCGKWTRNQSRSKEKHRNSYEQAKLNALSRFSRNGSPNTGTSRVVRDIAEGRNYDPFGSLWVLLFLGSNNSNIISSVRKGSLRRNLGGKTPVACR